MHSPKPEPCLNALSLGPFGRPLDKLLGPFTASGSLSGFSQQANQTALAGHKCFAARTNRLPLNPRALDSFQMVSQHEAFVAHSTILVLLWASPKARNPKHRGVVSLSRLPKANPVRTHKRNVIEVFPFRHKPVQPEPTGQISDFRTHTGHNMKRSSGFATSQSQNPQDKPSQAKFCPDSTASQIPAEPSARSNLKLSVSANPTKRPGPAVLRQQEIKPTNYTVCKG